MPAAANPNTGTEWFALEFALEFALRDPDGCYVHGQRAVCGLSERQAAAPPGLH